jgi:hypothetical protein
MVTDAMRTRFEAALADPQPAAALNTLARSLKAEGVTQATLYHLFTEYQIKTDGHDPRYDAIVDNLDLIWGGPWAKGGALFDHALTDADVRPSAPR